jgi:MoaA/NifB/PqqE/SkfB family radical SAM enzyme
MISQNGRYKKTTKRVRTKRGVLWLGQTCNLRCHFCYFLDRVKHKDHPEHAFMTFDKAKTICSTLVDVYGNQAIDIQGGEPTIYPEINQLTEHCRKIGLLPTLITNGIVLHKKETCRQLKDAGVRDLLISIHGLGEAYEKVVGVPGSHKKQMQALENCAELGIPFRFNCVLAKSLAPDYVRVAQLALDSGARVVNYITFNPFEDQQNKKRSLENVPTYSEIRPPLTEALRLLSSRGVECNVRYLPFCMLDEEFRPNIYNFQQLPYDLHEWDYASWSWTGQSQQRNKPSELTPTLSLRQANTHSGLFGKPGYLEDKTVTIEDEYRHSAMIRAREHCKYKFDERCASCALSEICDGFHGDYAELFGAGEAAPVPGEKTQDPLHYARHQVKIVEKDDYEWAS